MIGPEYTRRLPKVSTHVSSEEHQASKNTVGPIENHPYNVKYNCRKYHICMTMNLNIEFAVILFSFGMRT
ncbi:hypothetical protein AR158_C269L [Paramecium bursaria Chlorella virus AR158]|uniref:hypothetical protein n=1 Tax=Paramecium bursaria Chlorella virus AR158 TaxID=380598 RepID=UPI00015AA8DD|nr:hypothetical protein AR158_C269L [Paramecium bursaria Chlorella virus AR158]ABU43814.1 hypothetical protein AR158_C269L [Paramecium bursaria Chlorella virus AR158]